MRFMVHTPQLRRMNKQAHGVDGAQTAPTHLRAIVLRNVKHFVEHAVYEEFAGVRGATQQEVQSRRAPASPPVAGE